MAGEWNNVCPSCGAEESLDALILRMIDDDTARRLIHDTLKLSLPLGAQLMRYIRLHKPPKQRLRMSRLQELLTELVTDMQRSVIERHGRAWAVSIDDWRGGFDAVFQAVEKGTLQLPLQGNGYLYQVLTRKADQAESAQESKRELDRRITPQRDTVQVRGQTFEIGTALEVAFGGKDPALAEIEERSRKATRMPDDVRERIARIKGGAQQ